MTDALQLPPERTGYPAPDDLIVLRKYPVSLLEAGELDTDPAPLDVVIAGVRTLRYQPDGPIRGRVVHMHGGGFRLGIAEMSAQFASALAKRTGFEFICPDYRLAPEYPYPCGLTDGHKVLKVVQQENDLPLVVSGDSAGGSLASGMTALSVGEGRKVDGLMLLSAWLDLTVSAPAFDEKAATDPIFSRVAAEKGVEGYLQGVPPRDPLASPFFGSVEGFPPTFISIGDGEVLVDDALTFEKKLRAARVPTTLSMIPGMEHTAVARDLKLPGATETLDAMERFLVNTILGL